MPALSLEYAPARWLDAEAEFCKMMWKSEVLQVQRSQQPCLSPSAKKIVTCLGQTPTVSAASMV